MDIVSDFISAPPYFEALLRGVLIPLFPLSVNRIQELARKSSKFLLMRSHPDGRSGS